MDIEESMPPLIPKPDSDSEPDEDEFLHWTTDEMFTYVDATEAYVNPNAEIETQLNPISTPVYQA